MDSQAPFFNVDPETAADMLRQGRDPHELDLAMEMFLEAIYNSLPPIPVTTAGYLTARPAAAPSDGVDRISDLPDALLGEIVTRLPVKDAARTAALARRWRGVWSSAPLVLVDAHLLPAGAWPPTPAAAAEARVADTVSLILAAHPGPFRCVHLTSCYMGARRPLLERWLRIFAAKGVEELVLVNRPWPRDVPLHAKLFRIPNLTRLYVGVWKFPDAAALRGASFPHLRELGICSTETSGGGDIDSLVARSPALEILNIQGHMSGLRLRIVSKSLRCVQICASMLETIDVANAPSLDRLILSERMSPAGARGLCSRVKIGNAPRLRILGYLEPGQHVLEIHGTVIMEGIKASATTMLTTVKVLSLYVCFGVRNDATMVPTFLKCFPNIEALHIMSGKPQQQPSGQPEPDLKFWEKFRPVVSVVFRIKMMTFLEFHGEQSELDFLQFFFQSARVLERVVVVMANPIFTTLSVNQMSSRLMNLSGEKWASNFFLAVCGSNGPDGGDIWNFQRGADFSDDDPFSPVKVFQGGPASAPRQNNTPVTGKSGAGKPGKHRS